MVTFYHLSQNAQYLGTSDEDQCGNCLMYLQKLRFLKSIYYIFIAVNQKDARHENGKGNILLETHLKKANRKTKDTLGG
jgi:hypothetical protein